MAKRKSQSPRSGKPSSQPGGQRPAAQRPANAGARRKRLLAAEENLPTRRRRSEIRLRRIPGTQNWEFAHPRSVRDRAEDLEEVMQMIEAGEDDIAVDELRWLLAGCPDFIEAHKLLGELALAAEDVRLARAHFGFAYDIGLMALPTGELPGPFPYSRPANASFFEAAKGLAWCLNELNLADQARPILARMLELDPSDPLGAAALRAEIDRPPELRVISLPILPSDE